MNTTVPTVQPTNLYELIAHFYSLYGLRNTLRLHDPLARVALLAVGAKDLQDAIRKEVELEKTRIALARMVSRVACVAQHYEAVGIPLVASFAAKYLGGACSYCRMVPCQCRYGWRPPSQSEAADDRLGWSLGRCCVELDHVYGPANRKNGIDRAVGRLFAEIGEVTAAIVMPASGLRDFDTNSSLKEIASELGDVLAWVIGVSNLLGVELEGAVLERFWPVCRVCCSNPCRCGPFSFAPVVWSEI